MGVFVINSVAPVEIIAAAATDFVQVIGGGPALVAELADPIEGLKLSTGDIVKFEAVTAAVNAIAATPGGSTTIRTSLASPTQGTTASSADVWTGGIPVFNFAAMTGVTADPTSIWQEGEVAYLGDGSAAYWDGTAWQIGVAPLPAVSTGATAGVPGAFTPAGSTIPFDIAAMAPIIASPATLWTVGQNVVMGDTNAVYWDSAAWVAGVAPA